MAEELERSDKLDAKRDFAPPPSSAASRPDLDESSTLDQIADLAKTQATDATEAFRQGRLMEDAERDETATSEDKLIALLCYWSQIVMPFVMPVIVLLSESGKRRAFQRHHAVQSLGLTGAVIGLFLLGSMGIIALNIILPPIGFLVGILALCLSPIAYFMVLTAYLFYGWQSNKGKLFSIPVLSQFLRQNGWLS